MKQPYYRTLEMNKLYEAFCHEENGSSNLIDLNERKKKLITFIKLLKKKKSIYIYNLKKNKFQIHTERK